MLISEVPALKEYWYPVARSDSVGAEPVPFRLFAEDHVLWRGGDGTVHAAIDECPHRGGRLSQGWIENGCLVCPYHGWSFDSAGACVQIPQKDPALPIPPRARVRSILVEERYGLAWVCSGMPRAHIPDLPECEDSEWTMIHEIFELWNVSSPRLIDNALDVSHLSFVHKGTIGDPEHPRLSDFGVKREGTSLQFSVSYSSRVNELQRKNVGLTGTHTTRTTHAELIQPLVFRGLLEYENGIQHILFRVGTPVDDTHTIVCQFVARNDHPSPERQETIAALDRAVQNEDRRILEAIDPNFPIDLTTEFHTRADRMTVEFRRILADLAGETSLVRPDREWARQLEQRGNGKEAFIGLEDRSAG